MLFLLAGLIRPLVRSFHNRKYKNQLIASGKDDPLAKESCTCAVNSSATKLHYYATPAMPVRRRGEDGLLPQSHSHTTTAATGRGQPLAGRRSKASSWSVLHPKNGLRRNTALEEEECRVWDNARVTIPPLSSNLSALV